MQQANINKTQQNQPRSRKVYALRLGLDLERPSKVSQVQARIRQSNRMTAKQSMVARAGEIVNCPQLSAFSKSSCFRLHGSRVSGTQVESTSRLKASGQEERKGESRATGGFRASTACQGAQGKCQAMQQLADVVSQTAVACRVRASSAVLISIRSYN